MESLPGRRTNFAAARCMPTVPRLLLTLCSVIAAVTARSKGPSEAEPSFTLVTGQGNLKYDPVQPCMDRIKNPSTHEKRWPDVFFIGVSKCGTTSLANWLAHHPSMRWTSIHRLRMPKNDKGYKKDGLSQDDVFEEDMVLAPDNTYGLAIPPGSNDTTRLVFYAPHYVTITRKPYNIFNDYGSASSNRSIKYIVSLREPASRTISSWEFKFSTTLLKNKEGFNHTTANPGTGFRQLADAVTDGIEGANKLLECRGKDQEQPRSTDLEEQCVLDFESCPPESYLGPDGDLLLAHVGKGMYALQLERWFKLVGKENFKVIFFEEMIADPVGTLQEIFDFLGLELLDRKGRGGEKALEYWTRLVGISHNETSKKKKDLLGKQVTPGIMQLLRDHFAPHNTQLEHLLGRPVPESWSTYSA